MDPVQTLYDYVNDLNNFIKIGEDGYYVFTRDFDSETFTATDKKTEKDIKTRITLFVEEVCETDDIKYTFGLEGIDIEVISNYTFDKNEVQTVIDDYSEKIRLFVESQKKELNEQLHITSKEEVEVTNREYDLQLHLGRLFNLIKDWEKFNLYSNYDLDDLQKLQNYALNTSLVLDSIFEDFKSLYKKRLQPI